MTISHSCCSVYKMPNNRVVHLKELVVEKDFEWCLSPVISFAQLIGLPLISDDSSRSNKWRRRCSVYCSMLVLTANVAVSVCVLTTTSFPNKTTDQWNSFINTVNLCVALTATHASLLASTALKWSGLRHVFRDLSRQKICQREDYKALRRFCSIALALHITVQICR